MIGKVIIVGGGIAGLAVARGLLALGWQVSVCEQAPSFGAIGAGILLAPNGTRAMDWLGFREELRAKAAAHGLAAIRDSSGRWLVRTPVEGFQQRFGVPTFALHRAQLQEMLLGGAAGADFRWGQRVTDLREPGRPVISFEGPAGRGEEAADLVVAADGVRSTIRSTLFPGCDPTYAGYITWRGLVPGEAAPHGSRELGVTETWGRGQRFGIAPLGDGQVYWFATGSFPAGSHEHDDLDDLRARFAGWHEPIPALLAATPASSLLRHDIYHLKPPLPRYNVERVVLIGDAAHAMTPDIGQGGCQALEDAVSLVDVLSECTDVVSALQRFDELRRPRTQKSARVSALWGAIGEWHNPAAVWLRNNVTSLLSSRFLKASEGALDWEPPAKSVVSRSATV